MTEESKPRSLDDTNPLGTVAPHFKRRSIRNRFLWIAFILIFVIAAALFLFRGTKKKEPEGPHSLLEAQLLVNEITAMESLIYKYRLEIRQNREVYVKEGGDPVQIDEWISENLQDKSALQQAFEREPNEPRSQALKRIIQLQALISEIRPKISEKENMLGHAYKVKSGDSHYEIARDFLVYAKSCTPERTAEILKGLPLQQVLLPGNKIWNIWIAGEFSSFVTQGEAPIPPAEATQQAMQQAISRQREEKEKAQRRLNLLYYMVDTRESLIKKGILSGGIFSATQLANADPDLFTRSMDLRTQKSLRITAKTLGLKQIKALVLHPNIYSEGKDYRIRYNNTKTIATLILISSTPFRGQRLIIAVE